MLWILRRIEGVDDNPGVGHHPTWTGRVAESRIQGGGHHGRIQRRRMRRRRRRW